MKKMFTFIYFYILIFRDRDSGDAEATINRKI